MTVQFEKAVLPSTKIVKYSDVILHNPAEHAVCATRERIERFTSVCLAIVGVRTKSTAFGTSNPKRGSITGLPIVPLSVERLEPPPLPRPVGSDRTIPVVDFHYQLPHRLPAEVKCDLSFERSDRLPKQTGILLE